MALHPRRSASVNGGKVDAAGRARQTSAGGVGVLARVGRSRRAAPTFTAAARTSESSAEAEGWQTPRTPRLRLEAGRLLRREPGGSVPTIVYAERFRIT